MAVKSAGIVFAERPARRRAALRHDLGTLKAGLPTPFEQALVDRGCDLPPPNETIPPTHPSVEAVTAGWTAVRNDLGWHMHNALGADLSSRQVVG